MVNEQETPAACVRRLVRSATLATLATAHAGDNGWPYASLVQVATDDAGAPLLLLSDLAEHTRNIAADARVSLLFDGTAGFAEPLTGPRASLQGRAEAVVGARERARFLARHPGAAIYAGFRDFRFYRVEPARAHLVAGFGRITWIEGRDLVLPGTHAAAMAALEPGVLDHMNADHADAVCAMAAHLLGTPAPDATLIGFDAEGCDIRTAGRVLRQTFPSPVHDAAETRAMFAALAAEARLI